MMNVTSELPSLKLNSLPESEEARKLKEIIQMVSKMKGSNVMATKIKRINNGVS